MTLVVVLVLLTIIGGYMATRGAVQISSVALSIRTMQAWFAAQSGLDWAVHQATSSQATHDAICDAGATILTNVNLIGGAAAGYDVAITCDDSGGFTEGGTSFEVDVITAKATQGIPGSVSYVTRTVQAVITTGAVLP